MIQAYKKQSKYTNIQHFKDTKNIPLVDSKSKTSERKWTQIESTKTSECKNVVNETSKTMTAKENGGKQHETYH